MIQRETEVKKYFFTLFEIVFFKEEDASKAVKRCNDNDIGNFLLKGEQCKVFHLSDWHKYCADIVPNHVYSMRLRYKYK